jgi:glyoxylase-like metal-dependent hydrolase (beta-lactamase superfamily II)
MQEIAQEVDIETAYSGPVLGAINTSHGLLLIDAPIRPEDARSWKATLLSLGGAVDRLLINLDAHIDRTIGARAMECTVVGHESMALVFKNRPTSFKPQNIETGADWEQAPNLGVIRWAVPEISFNDTLIIHWGTSPMRLESRPGPCAGSIWAHLPEEKVVFVGDSLTPNQPPFLGGANLELWVTQLESLLKPEFAGYLIVSGRDGVVPPASARSQIHFLNGIRSWLEKNRKSSDPAALVNKKLPDLMQPYQNAGSRLLRYQQRLRTGLIQQLTHSYQDAVSVPEERNA